MTAANGLALIVLAGLSAYAVLGGADFGAGLWELLASGPRKHAQRDLLDRAMGPVWEANHVWLIFVVIALFSGFPGAFAALSQHLLVPISLALLGIVLRGGAFAFRHYGAPYGGDPVKGTRTWGRVFAIASLLTPACFGVAGGQLLSGGDAWAPLPLLGGALAVLCCSYLAATYLAADAAGIGDAALANDFRIRAIITGIGAGGLAVVGLTLVPGPVPLVIVFASSASRVGSLMLLRWRRYTLARVAAATAAATVLWGWAAVLHPWVIVGGLKLSETAAPASTANVVFAVLAVGLAIVTPCYAWMLRVLRPRAMAE
ncbi:MAG TPA: cytochrome d ubiquinol oxidase subunit II [Mycobacteriales bacterium]|jgi:cytochrome d ubiquinol oxidase subunit II|nr:cytochrome d ubiquinol oxidase subunit II [Mycobacteriales bacterium]